MNTEGFEWFGLTLNSPQSLVIRNSFGESFKARHTVTICCLASAMSRTIALSCLTIKRLVESLVISRTVFVIVSIMQSPCFAYLIRHGYEPHATGRRQSAPPNLFCRVPYRDQPEWKGQKLDTHNRHLDGLREGWGDYQPTVGVAKLGLTGADPRCSLHSRNIHSPILSRRLGQAYYCRLLIFIYIILQMRL